MAAVTKNAAKVRHLASGGTVILNDGTDDITVSLVNPDSVIVTPPFLERINYKDGNTPQVPLEGDKTTGSIEFTAIAGAITGTPDLITLATARATDNKVKTYTSFTFNIPDKDGATTGQRITMNNPWFENVPQYKGGRGSPDSIEGLKLVCRYADWSPTTY